MPEINYFWDEIEDNVVREYDENNNTVASYTTEPTLYGSVLSQDRQGEVRHYQFDGQGNTTELTDESGNVTDTRRHSAFGEVTESTGTTECLYQFGGRWGSRTVNGSPYVFVRRREYYPSIARWCSTDPSLARLDYAFVDNSPLYKCDPSGLDAVAASVTCTVTAGFWVFCPKLWSVCGCEMWAWRNEVIGTKWLSVLPNCPCIIGSPPKNPDGKIWNDPEKGDSVHHPGAAHCIRSKPTPGGHGQQCCYNHDGLLITEGTAAGTPDYGGFPEYWFGHTVDDVLSFWACCRAGVLWRYYKWRPPNNGLECPPRKIGETRDLKCQDYNANPLI